MNYAISHPLCRASDPLVSFQAADSIQDIKRNAYIQLTGKLVKSDSGRIQRQWEAM